MNPLTDTQLNSSIPKNSDEKIKPLTATQLNAFHYASSKNNSLGIDEFKKLFNKNSDNKKRKFFT